MSTRRILAMLFGIAVLAGVASQLPARPTAADQAPSARPLVAAIPLARTIFALTTDLPEPPTEDAPPPVPPAPPTPPDGPAAPPDCSKLKCVALTMDDGPVPGTAKVLDLLKRKQVHATFFVLGQLARRHPALLRRMEAEGHVVGNHSWNHPEFFGEPSKMIRGQIAHTDTVLRRSTGHNPVLMRPPYGEVTAKVKKACRRLHEAVVLWDVDPLDWKNRKASTVAHRVITHAKRGSIILTHDSLKTTRAAYARIIDGLRARGFTLVTVPELFGGTLTPGKVYLHG